MNPFGANDFWHSKKIIITLLTKFAIGVIGFLAVNDPNPRHTLIYGAIMAGFTALGVVYTTVEGKIDAAAVKKQAPETVINQEIKND